MVQKELTTICTATGSLSARVILYIPFSRNFTSHYLTLSKPSHAQPVVFSDSLSLIRLMRFKTTVSSPMVSSQSLSHFLILSSHKPFSTLVGVVSLSSCGNKYQIIPSPPFLSASLPLFLLLTSLPALQRLTSRISGGRITNSARQGRPHSSQLLSLLL